MSSFWKKPETAALLLSLLVACVAFFAFASWQQRADIRDDRNLRQRIDSHLTTIQSEVRLAASRRLQLVAALRAAVDAMSPRIVETFPNLARDLFVEDPDVLAAALVKGDEFVSVFAADALPDDFISNWKQDFPSRPSANQIKLSGPLKLGTSSRVLEVRLPCEMDSSTEAEQNTEPVELAVLFEHRNFVEEIESVVPGHLAVAVEADNANTTDVLLVGDSSIQRLTPESRNLTLPVGQWTIYLAPASGWPLANETSGLLGQLKWLFAISIGLLTYYVVLKTPYPISWFTLEKANGKRQLVMPGFHRLPIFALMPVLAVIVTSLLVFVVLRKQETGTIERRFQRQTETFVRRSQQEFERRLEKLSTVNGLFLASEDVSEDEFDEFVCRLLRNDAGFYSISWIAEQTLTGGPLTQVARQLERTAEVGEASQTTTDTAPLQVFECVSPYAGESWRGLRNWPDEDIRNLIDEAGELDLARIVSHDRMADNRLPPFSCPLVLSVPPRAGRQETGYRDPGVILALLNLEPLFRKEADTLSNAEIAVLVTERCPVNGNQIVFQKRRYPWGDDQTVITEEYTKQVAGRVWTYRFAALPAYVSAGRTSEPWLAMTAGLLLSSLVAIGIVRLHDRSVEMEEEAAARKGELTAAHVRLNREREETQLILDSIPSLIFLKDTDNRIVRVNKAVIDSLGKSRDEIEGQPSAELYPDNSEQFYRDDLAVIKSGQPKLAFVESIVDRWVRTDKIPIPNDTGTIDRILVIATDVTEQRRAESLVRAWFNATPEGMISVPLDRRIALVNDEVCSMFGLPDERLKGMAIDQLFEQTHDEKQNVDLLDLFENPPAESETVSLRLLAHNNEGRIFPVEVKVSRADPLEGTIVLLSITDLTESERIEADLQRTQELLEKTSEMSRIGGWEFDAVRQELHWSDEVCRIHDVPPGYQPTLQEALEFLTPDSQKLVQEAIEETMQSGVPYDLELEYVTASGRTVWGRAIGESEFKDGKCVRVWGALQDISNFKETERRLQLTRHAVEFSADAVYFVDRQGRLKYANQQATRDLGYSKEELAEMTVSDIAPQVPPGSWSEEWKRNKSHGNRLFESIHRRRDGSEFPCQIRTSFLQFESQELIVATVRDITQTKREAELRHTLFERSADAHLLFDNNGILECNQAAIDMLRMPNREALLGRHPAEFSPEYQPDGKRSDEVREELAALAYKNGMHRFDWIHTRADGEEFPCEVTLTAVELESGPALLVIWHDISERKKAEKLQRELTQQVVAANRALERTNAELKEFAYVASHDLQTPLRGISGFAQFLKEDYGGKLDKQADEYLNRITDGAQRMQRLIKDLLAYSQVDLASSAFASIDLNTLLDDVVGYLRAAIETNNAQVNTGPLPTIQGNATQLFQLFQNLIANALKYGNNDQTVIQISAEAREDEWVFRVQDNGIGIAPEHHDRIFQIFRRLHTQKEYEGTGVGLALCRRIVERHGGRIWVESEAGNGSCFQFTLPMDAKSPTM